MFLQEVTSRLASSLYWQDNLRTADDDVKLLELNNKNQQRTPSIYTVHSKQLQSAFRSIAKKLRRTGNTEIFRAKDRLHQGSKIETLFLKRR